MLELIGTFVIGIAMLALGADSLVRGAAALGTKLGAAPVAAGLLMVAFGGSVPDLAVNADAVLRGHADLALGNIIGSCLVNLGLGLGLGALAAPLAVRLPLMRPLFPALVVTALALFAMSWNGRIGYFDGIVLVLGFFVVAWLAARHHATRADPEAQATFAQVATTRPSPLLNVLRVVVGIALLVYGARWSIDGVAGIARTLAISEMLAGLTVLAIGTSLPQVFIAIFAARRGHGDVVMLGLIGSSLFNLLLLLGLTAIVNPLMVPASLLKLELPALIAFTLALYPLLRGDLRVSRGEGAVLATAFLALTTFQFAV